jgi:hypothetical protein
MVLFSPQTPKGAFVASIANTCSKRKSPSEPVPISGGFRGKWRIDATLISFLLFTLTNTRSINAFRFKNPEN